MNDELKKKWSEIVLEERDKGNVVCILLPDTWGKTPVKEIIRQPVDGLLWDLNRSEEVALSWMDQEGMIHWVNNFAVALVIRELKKQLDASEAFIDVVLNMDPNWENAKAYREYIQAMGGSDED